MKSQDGRKVKSIWWNGFNGDLIVYAPKGGSLVFSSEYRGDREEEWILATDAQGKEVERHNVRTIASIVWDSPDGK